MKRQSRSRENSHRLRPVYPGDDRLRPLAASIAKDLPVKATYKTYTIVTEPMKRADVGWTARVSVYDTSSVLVMRPLELGQAVIFATSDLADHAAVLLGRAWVDHPETP